MKNCWKTALNPLRLEQLDKEGGDTEKTKIKHMKENIPLIDGVANDATNSYAFIGKILTDGYDCVKSNMIKLV